MGKTYVIFPESDCMTIAQEIQLHAMFIDQLKVVDQTWQRTECENPLQIRVLVGENTLDQDRLLIYFGEMDNHFKVTRALPLIGNFWGNVHVSAMNWLLAGCAKEGSCAFDADTIEVSSRTYDLLNFAYGNFLKIFSMQFSMFNCDDRRLIQDGSFSQSLQKLGWFERVTPKSEG